MSDHHYHLPVTRLGSPDEFAEQGAQEELHEHYGYSAAKIVSAVKLKKQLATR